VFGSVGSSSFYFPKQIEPEDDSFLYDSGFLFNDEVLIGTISLRLKSLLVESDAANLASNHCVRVPYASLPTISPKVTSKITLISCNGILGRIDSDSAENSVDDKAIAPNKIDKALDVDAANASLCALSISSPIDTIQVRCGSVMTSSAISAIFHGADGTATTSTKCRLVGTLTLSQSCSVIDVAALVMKQDLVKIATILATSNHNSFPPLLCDTTTHKQHHVIVILGIDIKKLTKFGMFTTCLIICLKRVLFGFFKFGLLPNYL
jgi:hypothetical protein